MRLLFTAISIVLLLSNCDFKRPQTTSIDVENITEQQIDSIMDNFQFAYDNPTFLEASDYVMFPMTTGISIESKRKLNSNYSSYASLKYNNWWNMLFYNQQNHTTRLLTEEKFQIDRFSTNFKDAGAVLNQSILYLLSEDNYPKNREKNLRDPSILYISDKSGQHLNRLSPINENVYDFTLIPKTDKILVRTKRDENQDSLFNIYDPSFLYIVDVAGDAKPKLVIDTTNQKLIEHLYFEQWVKEKLSE